MGNMQAELTQRMQNLCAKIKAYNPSSDSERLMKAFEFAMQAHGEQRRDSGEPYITHPLAVAEILADLKLDDASILAALFHDVLEDTSVTKEELTEKYGAEVVHLVQGVTKLSKISYGSKQERQAENLRKMFLAMAEDIRIILIKLADRLHNMRTIQFHHSAIRRIEIAEETLQIFAPLAHRLGIFKIKDELEELFLKTLQPEKYNDLVQKLAARKPEDEKNMEAICANIKRILKEHGYNAEVKWRFKSYYSIYKKMERQQKDLNEIYDLNAIRVIVDTVNECYAALGVIHTMWTPIPGRFKDYIAMPKQNMYQSIHTTVIAAKGQPMEVQIRTHEMDSIAEFGIAAHWKYKEGGGGLAQSDKKVEWLRQMLDWQTEMRDANEFLDSVKLDLSTDCVYVFSPKGDVYELPRGSCPIDFAYRVHTQVGHQCIGAKVNKRIVPIDYKLNNGDIVEILTAKGSGPSRDWLKIVASTQAQNKIRTWFRKEKRDENIVNGKEMLEKEVRKNGFDPDDFLTEKRLTDVARKFNMQGPDDIYAGLGDGGLQISQVLSRMEGFKKEQQVQLPKFTEPKHNANNNGVWVKGVSGVMIRMANCCKPLPGDSIMGYITKGRGISVHLTDCPNMIYYRKNEPDRLIEVGWSDEVDGLYQVGLEVIAQDRERLSIDVMAAIADTKTTINGCNIFVDRKTESAIINLKFEVKSQQQLDYIINRIKRVKSVLQVHRIAPKKQNK